MRYMGSYGCTSTTKMAHNAKAEVRNKHYKINFWKISKGAQILNFDLEIGLSPSEYDEI